MAVERARVAFFMRHAHHYRDSFYWGLKNELAARGIDFELIHGDPSPREASKGDAVNPEWALRRPNRIVTLAGRDLIYQPVFRESSDYDLILIEQASRLLVNYGLHARRWLGRGPGIGLVGHGANLAHGSSALGEGLKRFVLDKSDWFFAYTEGTKERLTAAGYPPDRVTVFENTIDTAGLRAELASISPSEITEFRTSLGAAGSHLVLTLGSLYPDKRPDLIGPTCDLLADRRDGVHFVVVGSGPSAAATEIASHTNVRMHVLPAKFGREKAIALRSADLLFVPGVAGLIVLDSFIAGVPIVTGPNAHHPPEVDYLRTGANCSIVERSDSASFAEEISRLLDDDDERSRLSAGALESGAPLTVENMVNRFCDGIEAALAVRSV